MISKSALACRAQHVLRCAGQGSLARRYATAASGSFNYETSEAAGVKIASRDIPGPTAHLAVVARAGTRFQPLPGYSEALDKFAFKATNRRSALRIQREAELLGARLSSYHTRENLVIEAEFIREDLAYFTELLGEVISQTKYTAHELEEEVNHIIEMSRKELLANTAEFALSSAHTVAFHRGLGNPLHPTSANPTKRYLNADVLGVYSKTAYAKPNIAVVANGVVPEDLKKWVGEFFTDTSAGPSEGEKQKNAWGSAPTKYHGGEERIGNTVGNAMVLGFPGSGSVTGPNFKPELSVLAALLGGQSTIKWTPGFSLLSRATEAYPQAHILTEHHTYSDAGLMTVTITGQATQVRGASKEVVKALKNTATGKIEQEDIKKAKALAKFRALESGQLIATGIELTGAGLIKGGKPYQLDEIAKSLESVTDEQVRKAAKTLLDGKASVSSVGDLFVLPFAEELELHV